jgi:tetratricopeptide (TPR) repeat protein
MPELEPPDSHTVSAALGWLQLGNPAEAKAELAEIGSENLHHPDVLEARWMILAQESDWIAALPVAHSIVKQAPDRASGWLHFAYALRRVPEGGLDAAWHALLPASDKFPAEPVIPYNLACYACQMGQFDEARKWLTRALKVGKREEIRRMALDDLDLQPLWEELRKL